MQQVEIRPYLVADETSVLALMDLNIPRWFAPAERAALVHYLAHEREDYFVLDHQGQVIGCGGINYLPAEQQARISWDILHPNFQGQGYGSLLLQHRLALLRTTPDLSEVVVRTSQLVYPFYEKSGFRLVRTVVDYWAPGFDLYEMVLILK